MGSVPRPLDAGDIAEIRRFLLNGFGVSEDDDEVFADESVLRWKCVDLPVHVTHIEADFAYT